MNSNENNKGVDFSSILVLVFVVGAIFVLFELMEKDKIKRQEAQIVVGNEEIKPDNEQTPNVEEPIEKPTEPIVDEPPVEEEPQQSTKPQTTNKDKLKCTYTIENEYGKFDYTQDITFKYNEMLKSKLTVTATLKKSKMKYRDSLIQAFKDENSQFIELKGISDSVKKTNKGFIYTVKIDAEKLSDKELADLGYRTLNYSGVRMNAYNNGYKCE